MRKELFFIVTLLFIGCSCKGTSKKEQISTETNMNNTVKSNQGTPGDSITLPTIDIVKKYLALQEKSPCGDDYADFPEDEMHIATVEDIQVALPFMAIGLHKNGYMTPSQKDFYKVIKEVFQVDLTKSSEDIQFALWPGQRLNAFSGLSDYHFDRGVFLVSTKYRILFYSDFLYNFVDIVDDNLQIQTPPLGILTLNQYLFNGCNKSMLNTLSTFRKDAEDDGFLLKWIYYNFLYDKDVNLNVALFKQERECAQNLRPLTFKPITYFFQKRDNGLYVSEPSLEAVKNLTNRNDSFYLELLGMYIYNLACGDIKHDFTEDEMAEIFSHFAVLESFLRNKYMDTPPYVGWNKQPFSYVIDANYPQYFERIQKGKYSQETIKIIEDLIQQEVEAR